MTPDPWGARPQAPAAWEPSPPAPAPPALREVHLWRATLDPHDAPTSGTAAALGLDHAERTRLARFRLPEGAARYAQTRGLLRRVLGRILGVPPADVPIETGTGGKPVLARAHPARALHFNLAHTGDLVVVAVCPTMPVGIDVEELAPVPDLDALAARVLHPAERALLSGAGAGRRLEQFLQLWTRKEALLKGMGVGLSEDVAHTSVADPARPVYDAGPARAPGEAEAWIVHDLGVSDGFVGALAVRGQTIRIRGFEETPGGEG